MLHILLQHLIWYFVKLLLKTYRYKFNGQENLKLAKSLSKNNSYILALWHEHGASLLAAHAWTVPYLAMASRSKDGDYAAFVCKKVGFVPVRGSSRKRGKDKGGKEALLEYIHKLKEGVDGGLTVDGPKGPRHVCKPGIVVMAQQSGAAIVPLYGIADSYWEFNSWDRFKIPKPFTRITITYGKPFLVNKESTPEQINEVCREVEKKLMALEQTPKE